MTISEIRIFFAWQDDLAATSNKNAIRTALKAASKNIKNVKLVIDEATRGVPGSVNIPKTIMEKINAADIFVADVTRITPAGAKKHCPNPNVTFELGVAAQHLGWERIILLVNTEFGSVKDLPFDFDRHRALMYEMPEQPTKKDRLKFAGVLKSAVELIVDADPPKRHQLGEFSPEKAKRLRDLKQVQELFRVINWPTVQDVVDKGPHSRSFIGTIMYDVVEAYYSSGIFHVYDDELRDAVEQFMHAFSTAMSHTECYHLSPSGQFAIFAMHMDLMPAGKQEKWDVIEQGCRDLFAAKERLLELVRDAYPEIDIVETSDEAWRYLNS